MTGTALGPAEDTHGPPLEPHGPAPEPHRPALTDRVPLGGSGLNVSRLGLGCSALGGVFGEVDEGEAIATVHAALEAGINLLDVAPAYGATRSEQVLGRALAGVNRASYVLSTKAGKNTDDNGHDHFDYSEEALRYSVDLSMERLGVDHLDIVHLHDFDYQDGRHVEQALEEGFPTLQALKTDGLIGAVGAGIYFMDIWKRVLNEVALDVILLHNHHTLCDIRAFELLPLLADKDIGVINAAPFASGLLTGHAPAPWHPAQPADRELFARAARLATERGSSIARLALAFSCQEPRLPVTIFSCADRNTLADNLRWAVGASSASGASGASGVGTASSANGTDRPVDRELVAEVQALLEPVMNKQWPYGKPAEPNQVTE